MSSVLHARAGQYPLASDLIDLSRLLAAYSAIVPDISQVRQRVSFGTSGHRGSALDGSFNEAHILAITQAICDYRKGVGITGPLFIGKDTHALSAPALDSALDVLLANEITVMVDAQNGYTPTPAISHAIITYNQDHADALADGIVITPSHNPPADGGFKYNPPHGGPAESSITSWIENRANHYLAVGLTDVKRTPRRDSALRKSFDFIGAYIGALDQILDMAAIRDSGVSIGIDPLGGAALDYWQPLIERYGLNAKIVNPHSDPQFAFMTLDWDGKIRMDCSSAYAMAPLLQRKDDFDLCFGNDTDADRHGIVCRSGLMPSNHFLAAAMHYLRTTRGKWGKSMGIGKTIVSSSMIDRVAASLDAPLFETPVGFKFFVDGLHQGTLGFAGEESAGASFLRKDGTVWTTDKDGLIAGLLAAEICATTGRDPAAYYADLADQLGHSHYARIDAAASPAQKAILSRLTPDQITDKTLAGDPILDIRSTAPGNDQPFGGIKLRSEQGWFAARPSGTEDVYKIYAESFRGPDHLAHIQAEAQALLTGIFARA